MSLPRHKVEELGLCGNWENITRDLNTKTWASSDAGVYDGSLCGIELKHDGNHIGVMFPEGRLRVTTGNKTHLDPSDGPAIVEKGKEKYAVCYIELSDGYPNLVVYREESRCGCCSTNKSEYSYCPHCGCDLP